LNSTKWPLSTPSIAMTNIRHSGLGGYWRSMVQGLCYRTPWPCVKNLARLRGREIQDERPYALASVLYGVLNRVALEATLGKAYEIDLAVEHLKAGKVLAMDRNYPSYRMLAATHQYFRDFVVRRSADAQRRRPRQPSRPPDTVCGTSTIDSATGSSPN